MSADDPLRTAVQRYCASIARDRLLVQAAGGNISWKSGDTLWIKASGTWLADAEQKDIFVPVDRKPIDAALASGDYNISPKVEEGYSLRPSIETLLHALMPHTFVVHLHPVDAFVHLICPNSKTNIQNLIGDALQWDFVDYHKPGSALAQAVHATTRAKPDLQVVFLKNHGVILGANSLDEIHENLKLISERLHSLPRDIPRNEWQLPSLNAINLEGTGYQFCKESEFLCLGRDVELYGRLQTSWAICPDHVVFLGAEAICLDAVLCGDIRQKLVDSAPPFIFIKDCGVIEKKTVTAAEKAQLVFFMDVMTRLPPEANLELLKPEQIANLLNWDAEKYRRSINQTTA